MPTMPRLVRRSARGRITRVVLVALLLALAGVPVTAAAQPEAPLADTAKRADWATVQALLLQLVAVAMRRKLLLGCLAQGLLRRQPPSQHPAPAD